MGKECDRAKRDAHVFPREFVAIELGVHRDRKFVLVRLIRSHRFCINFNGDFRQESAGGVETLRDMCCSCTSGTKPAAHPQTQSVPDEQPR